MPDDRCTVHLQVLGSGGPMHAGGRGAAAYLIWRGSRPVLVVDMGGDTPTALARAGVAPSEIGVLAISHVHPDHVSGIPDFIWGEMTADRNEPLDVIGPPSRPKFHDAPTLFEKLFAVDGAFPDLAKVADGNSFPLRFVTAAGDGGVVHASDGIVVRALSVNHGRAPTLAFRIEIGTSAIVLAGDQTMDSPAFVSFARDADVMVAHAIANRLVASSPLDGIVARPASIGAAAREADVRHLVIGHLMNGGPASGNNYWSLADLSGVVTDIRRQFDGALSVANDLDRYALDACVHEEPKR